MTPIVCVITDRRRAGERWETELPATVAAAAQAGVDLVQVREPGLDGGPLTALVARCVEGVAGTAARVIVNDRLDVALAAAAHGVHLPGDGPPATRVRALAPPGFLVGRSVHGAAEARAAAGAGGLDYLILGTVFPTVSKPGRSPCGTDELAAVADLALPVLAVGGVTLDRVPAVAAAGASGVAAIGLFADTPAGELGACVRAIRRMFGAPAGLS